ncbi:MAG: MBL fold metallo-hydrolase [Alphaproteobacteria bacterium]
MTLRVTFLGCGTSTGVPRIDGHWGKCNPANPKNRRRRSSLLVERFADVDAASADDRHAAKTTILIDTGPDVREQLLSAQVSGLDGVLYSHDHADHTHGIDDLRIMCYARRKLVDLYFNRPTGELLMKRFDYCFATQPGSNYPPIVKAHIIEPGQPITIAGAGGDVTVQPFRQLHGVIETLGFRIGGLAYSTDVHDFPDESLPTLEGLDMWIVDALRPQPHASHLSVGQALEWVERLQPKRAIFTHLAVELDYDELSAMLPPDVEAAYDGMRFTMPY